MTDTKPGQQGREMWQEECWKQINRIKIYYVKFSKNLTNIYKNKMKPKFKWKMD